MTARNEQETTVTSGRDDDCVYVWTNNPIHARKLDADARAELVWGNEVDEFGGQYRIKTTDFDPLKGFRRAKRELTEEQRAAVSERLAAARKRKENA